MSKKESKYLTIGSVNVSDYTNDDGSNQFNLQTKLDLTLPNGVVIPSGTRIALATPFDGAPDFVKYNAIIKKEKLGITSSGDL